MNKAKGFLLAVAAAAMAFTVSCTSDIETAEDILGKQSSSSEGDSSPSGGVSSSSEGGNSSSSILPSSSSVAANSSSSGEAQCIYPAGDPRCGGEQPSSSSRQNTSSSSSLSSSSSSSSSSRQNTSSSSGPPRNCDEGYDTEVEFCYSDNKVYPLCGAGTSGMYNPTVTGCCNSVKFTLAAEVCVNNVLMKECGGELYAIETHFCDRNQIYKKCNGAIFNPGSGDMCMNDVLMKECGGVLYATETHFCDRSQMIYEKCNGATFDPEINKCENGLVKAYCFDSRDDKEYKTAVIGTQTWMAENLNYNANGSKCYSNLDSNCDKYGRLYDWATAKTACPSRWHLPTQAEWNTLSNYVKSNSGCSSCDARLLKATSGWNDYQGTSGNGTDQYGFSALPGGYYGHGYIGSGSSGFSSAGSSGNWWSASEIDSYNAYSRFMDYDDEGAGWYDHHKSGLFSVRCLQD